MSTLYDFVDSNNGNESEQKQDLNWHVFLMLTRDVPFGLNKNKDPELPTSESRKIVLERDNRQCRICGESVKRLDVHHIIPNGKAIPDNLITLCLPCHMRAHDLLSKSGKWDKNDFGKTYNKNILISEEE